MVTPMHSALGWLHRNGFGACLSLAERARCIRLLLTDCDGVLTDGTVYYSAEGEALKRFHMRDGMGVERLRSAVEVDVGIISGETSPALRQRAAKLGIDELHLGIRDKQAVLAEIIARRGLALEQVAYIGDDVNDVTVMELVGLAACPADATPFARTAAHMICQTLGGAGVLREVAELIIAAHATPPSNGAARAVAPADAALAGLRATVRDQWRCFDERSEW
jgi:3-deoxy-D-manno-octulosonate 8-phosphate phosphatase (KDO 8-P phosphatase)